jgi:two-component system LytT family sensor kinase
MLVSAAWIGPAILGGIDVVVQQRLYGEGPVPIRAVIFVTGDWLLYALLTPAVFVIASTWPLARPHLFRRAILHLCASLLFCAAWAGAGTVLKALVDPQSLAASGGAGIYFVSWIFITLPFGVAVYLAVVGIEHAIRYFVEAREREIQLARLSEQLSGARFAALQAQLNPHFLFNTLNTIAVLVRDGDKTAARIVEQLSDVLRRTLTRHRTAEVPLAEELELVRQYLAIEQARFSDRLRPRFEIDETVLSAAVPGFALQHLVENAIRHGIAKRSDAGRVDVVARLLLRAESRGDRDVLELSVTDDGPGIDPEAAAAVGHGLENTRERLRALYGDRASLVVRRSAVEGTIGTIATLRLPYHEIVLESDRGTP